MQQADLENLIDTKQLQEALGVTRSCIHKYRTLRGLPCVHLTFISSDMPPVRYDKKKVLEWAQSQGIQVKKPELLQ